MSPTAQPFNWTEYLRLAAELSEHPDEASNRTSISRAYYFVFHAATIQAQKHGYAGETHKKLWALYQADSDRNCRRLSTLGNNMKAARKEADYSAIMPDIPARMAQQLADANEFTSILATVPGSSPKP